MEYRRLGQTDLLVSSVGFGCAAMGGYDYGPVDDQDSIAAVQTALDLGITLFDTADVYGLGHAEQVLGKALGARRHEVVVATKFGVAWDTAGKTYRDCSPQRVVEALEASLRRLQLDCIPLYQIHWPDQATPVADTLAALLKCRASGKIRWLGCCNFPLALVDEAQAAGRLESLQVPYNLGQREFAGTIQHCRQVHNMSILCYNPLAQGLFTGKYGRDSQFEGTDLRRRSALFAGDRLEANLALLDRLRQVSERCGRTVAQVAIRWALSNPAVTAAISGIKTPRQARENAGAADWSLAQADLEFLEYGTVPQEEEM